MEKKEEYEDDEEKHYRGNVEEGQNEKKQNETCC
jgi:hypothetical protein